MSDLLKPTNLVKDAQFNIDWRKAEIIKAKIRADFTNAPGDHQDLARHFRELQIEQNYLKVLLDKFESMETEKTVEAPTYLAVLNR